jgi:hypothetical protein
MILSMLILPILSLVVVDGRDKTLQGDGTGLADDRRQRFRLKLRELLLREQELIDQRNRLLIARHDRLHGPNHIDREESNLGQAEEKAIQQEIEKIREEVQKLREEESQYEASLYRKSDPTPDAELPTPDPETPDHQDVL